MTPRREIGFLRSLLGQEEDENQETESPAKHPSAELADIAQADFESPAPAARSTGAPAAPIAPAASQPIAPAAPAMGTTYTQIPSTPQTQTEAAPAAQAPAITKIEQPKDFLDMESEVPAPSMTDHDIEVPEAPRVIQTEPELSLNTPTGALTPAPVEVTAAPVAGAGPAASLGEAIAYLKSPSVERRRDALRALSVMDMDQTAYAAVAGALQDPEHDVRSLALRVLERDPSSAPLEAIAAAALDADPGIRARAMALLGRSNNSAVVGSLVDRIGGEEHEVVIGAALGGVARLLDSIETTRLAQHSAENLARSIARLAPVVRSRYRREVGLIAGALPESWIVDGLSADDSSLRKGMAILAAERGSVSTISALARLSADEDVEVRDLAISAQITSSSYAVPETPAPAAVVPEEVNGFDNELENVTIPVLMTALKDPQPAVRERAETALRAIRPARIASWLVPHIKESEPEEAAHLAEVALRLNVAEAVSPLVDHVLELEPGPAREKLSSALKGFSGIDTIISSWQADPDRDRRIAAIRWAGLVGPKGSSGIEAGLRDPSATVRLASIEAAGSAHLDEKLAVTLINTLSTDSSSGVRLASARAFLGAERVQRVRAAELALRDPDREIRRTGVELLSGATGDETSLLVRALQDPDPEVAGRAATVVSQAPGQEALATLWNALRTSGQDVRQTIIDALLGFGPEVLGRLARQAYESTTPSERALGLAMLVRLGNGGSHALLIDSLSDPSTDVRAEALAAIVLKPESMDIDAVGARVRDPHAKVRALAVDALSALDDDRALPFLLDASHDPVEDVRTAARASILTRSSTSVAKMLIDALAAPNLRRTSAELLTQMGPVATQALVDSLSGADGDLKRVVGETLAAAGAAEGLIEDLSDRSAERRARAIEALGAMRAGGAIDALIIRLEDPESLVRARAAEVLGDLADVRAVEPLKRIFVTDPDMDVVAATEKSLRKLTGPPTGGLAES